MGWRVGLKRNVAGPAEDGGEIIFPPYRGYVQSGHSARSAGEMDDGLHVKGLGEQIDQMHLLDAVA